MKKVKFSASPLHELGNIEFYEFVQSQVDRIRALSDTELTDDQLKALVATMLVLLIDLNKVLVRMRKSAITSDISTLDQVRDNSMRAFIRAMKVHELSVEKPVLRAVAEIEAMLKLYGNVPGMKLEEKTKAIESIVEALESPRYAAIVDMLGLKNFVTRIKADNSTFKERYNERTTAYIEKDTTDTREIRNKVNEQYSLLCDYVEVNTRLETKPEFAKVFTIIDTIRKQYAAQVGRSAERKPKTKKEDTAKETSDDRSGEATGE